MRFKTTLVLAAAFAGVTLAGASGQSVDASAIAKKGAAGIPACESCHTGAGQFPTISGQQDRYIIAQLVDFKKGVRVNSTMQPIAKQLSTEQIMALATYYSTQPKKKAPAPEADAALIEKGRVIATDGDVQRDLFACDRCHGKEGNGGDFAVLAGQNPTYLAAQVKALREGKRENDELGIMQAIAKKVTDEEVRAIAAYYNSVVK